MSLSGTKLCAHFTHKYTTLDALGIFDAGVIRANIISFCIIYSASCIYFAINNIFIKF